MNPEIERQNVLFLEKEACDRLLTIGDCIFVPNPEWHAKAPTSEIVLAVDVSASEYWHWEVEPKADLEAFLRAARFAHFDLSNSRIHSPDDVTFGRWIASRSEETDTSSLPLLDPTAFCEGSENTHLGGLFPIRNAVDALRMDSAYLGPFAICGCGEPGCGAGYAWIEQGVCRMFLEISAVAIWRIRILPFRITSEVLAAIESCKNTTPWPR